MEQNRALDIAHQELTYEQKVFSLAKEERKT